MPSALATVREEVPATEQPVVSLPGFDVDVLLENPGGFHVVGDRNEHSVVADAGNPCGLVKGEAVWGAISGSW